MLLICMSTSLSLFPFILISPSLSLYFDDGLSRLKVGLSVETRTVHAEMVARSNFCVCPGLVVDSVAALLSPAG